MESLRIDLIQMVQINLQRYLFMNTERPTSEFAVQNNLKISFEMLMLPFQNAYELTRSELSLVLGCDGLVEFLANLKI